jgi:hypothetical protein
MRVVKIRIGTFVILRRHGIDKPSGIDCGERKPVTYSRTDRHEDENRSQRESKSNETFADLHCGLPLFEEPFVFFVFSNPEPDDIVALHRIQDSIVIINSSRINRARAMHFLELQA